MITPEQKQAIEDARKDLSDKMGIAFRIADPESDEEQKEMKKRAQSGGLGTHTAFSDLTNGS
jgi:hypothetical protein